MRRISALLESSLHTREGIVASALPVPLAGGLSSDLHRDRKEASIVTGRVALEEGLDLFGRRGRHVGHNL